MLFLMKSFISKEDRMHLSLYKSIAKQCIPSLFTIHYSLFTKTILSVLLFTGAFNGKFPAQTLHKNP